MEGFVVRGESCPEVVDRLVHEAHRVVRLAEVVPHAGVPRLEAGGALELDDCVGLPTEVEERRAQAEGNLEAARAGGVCPPEALERVGEPPLPHELRAALEMALGVFSH